MLKIENLHASVDGKKILKGINLEIGAGEVHAIMGPNGSGKSTLSNVIAGRDGYEITAGSVTYNGKDLLEMSPEERAWDGVYLLKAGVNAKRKHMGLPELDAMDFMKIIKEKAALVDLDQSFLSRGVNEGFSGGEKKRNEIFQMAVLEPALAILDETDSGLDIDALRIVANGVNKLRSPERSIVMVTHYQRLLDYIEPDFVHVLADGKVLKSGDKSLALELEDRGYDWVRDEVTA